MNRIALCLIAAFAAAPTFFVAHHDACASDLPQVIDQVQPKMAKLYGAGGYRGLEAYQTGIVISPAGHVLTVWSYVLDAETITVVLNDGRRYEAELAGADPRLEIAVLKPLEEMADLPYFDLELARPAAGGTRVVAFSNLFGVAVGDEPASVQHGCIMAKADMRARRGAFETVYQGPIYILDVVTSNPGAAGGALTDVEGRLVGLIGRELRSTLDNTWLNYALPIEELRGSVAKLQAGELLPVRPEAEVQDRARNPVQLADLGIELVPDVLERTPAYIDQVLADSPGFRAGLRADDLVLMVNGRLVQSRKLLEQELLRCEADEPLQLTVIRDQETLLEFQLTK